MPTNTPNLGLIKPLVTENYTVEVANDNADILDEAFNDLDLEKVDTPTVDKVTPVDADVVVLLDSADTFKPKKWSIANVKLFLQEKLVSGTNIKTVNGESLLGSGNLSIDWNIITATLTYASADSPTFVANTSVDLTSVISVGMKLKFTQTTIKYFIVTAITSNTITLYGGTDYTLANATITLPYFSSMKAPFGFPMSPDKWSVILTDITNRLQNNPVQNTWYNLGGLSITLPIGIWDIKQKLLGAVIVSAVREATIYSTISTTNNSETIPEFTVKHGAYTLTETDVILLVDYSSFVVTSKTIYYLNSKTDIATGITTIYFLNGQSKLVIKAICAYL